MTSKLQPGPSRRSHVAPFMAMDVLREAAALERQGRRIIHMEVGEPAASPPLAVREAAINALAGGRIGYTEALGLPSLRAAIAGSYRALHGVDISAERIAVTTGSSGGFILAFLGCFDPGARIAISEPGYPAYRNLLEALGLEPVALPVSAATRFAVTAEMIEAAHRQRRLDGVLLMSPTNPSGTMLMRGALADICNACDRLGLRFISDEIYHGLTYERAADTALAFSGQAIVVNSFSKYYCMTGWRVGWLVLPEELVRPIERLQQSLAISVPYLSQVAAEAAFGARDELETVRRQLREKPVLFAGGAAEDRHRRLPSRRRRLLHLRGHRALHQRLGGLLQAHVGRGGRGRDNRARLRPAARTSDDALVVCRLARRHSRGGIPPRRLAALSAQPSPVRVAFARCHQPPRFGRSGSASVITF